MVNVSHLLCYFIFAEKGCCGYEEGWCQGPNHDDLFLTRLVHYSICARLPDIGDLSWITSKSS